MQDPIALVPTMGALHAGHLELIKQARKLSPSVVLSIFVNPLQFDNPDDLARYPRDLVADTQKAMSAGAAQVWAPEYSEIYPNQITKISAGILGKKFEGREREGHFDGMLTVVNRLFEIVKPTFALFGEKDFQQLFIVKKWVKENEIPVRIISVPTVRASDGLSLSSRNARLSVAGHQRALAISRALCADSKSEMHRILHAEPGLTLDYAEIIDEDTFEVASSATSRPRGIIAGWVEKVRLIDNMTMGVNQ